MKCDNLKKVLEFEKKKNQWSQLLHFIAYVFLGSIPESLA